MCPFGTEPNSDKSACVNCAAGKYRNAVTDADATSDATATAGTCVTCPAGAYAIDTGSTECQTCSTGYEVSSGGAFCNKCVAGYFVSAKDNRHCIACDAGKSVAGELLTVSTPAACDACEMGKYADAAGTTCTACP